MQVGCAIEVDVKPHTLRVAAVVAHQRVQQREHRLGYRHLLLLRQVEGVFLPWAGQGRHADVGGWHDEVVVGVVLVGHHLHRAIVDAEARHILSCGHHVAIPTQYHRLAGTCRSNLVGVVVVIVCRTLAVGGDGVGVWGCHHRSGHFQRMLSFGRVVEEITDQVSLAVFYLAIVCFAVHGERSTVRHRDVQVFSLEITESICFNYFHAGGQGADAVADTVFPTKGVFPEGSQLRAFC